MIYTVEVSLGTNYYTYISPVPLKSGSLVIVPSTPVSPGGAISTCRKCEPVTKALKNKGFKYKCIQYCECPNSGRFVDLKSALLEAKEQYDSDLINWGV